MKKILFYLPSAYQSDYLKATGMYTVMHDLALMFKGEYQIDVLSKIENFPDINKCIYLEGHKNFHLRLLDVLKDEDYDILHVHESNFHPPMIREVAKMDKPIKIIITMHLTPVYRSFAMSFPQVEKLLEDYPNLQFRVLWVSPGGDHDGFKMLHKYERVKGISNFISNPYVPVTDISKLLPIEDRPIDVIHVGRLEPSRKIEIFLEFMKMNPDKKGVLVGGLSAMNPDYSKKMIAEAELIDNVDYIEHIDRDTLIKDYTSKSKYIMMCSTSESDSMAVKEALSMGCSLLSTTTPYIQSMYKNYFKGKGLIVIDTEVTYRKSAKTRARLLSESVAVNTFDPKEISDITVDLYNPELIGQRYREFYEGGK